MKIICAWCKQDMGERANGIGITHGICPSCKATLMHEIRQTIVPMDRRTVTSYKFAQDASPLELYS